MRCRRLRNNQIIPKLWFAIFFLVSWSSICAVVGTQTTNDNNNDNKPRATSESAKRVPPSATAKTVGSSGGDAGSSGSGSGAASSKSKSMTKTTRSPKSQESQVLELTSGTFDSSLWSSDRRTIWLVEFYASWCSHCLRFAPSYDEIAKKLSNRYERESIRGDDDDDDDDGNVAASNSNAAIHPIKVVKIDGDSERALASRFGVGAYPSFFLIDGWSVYEFDDIRSVENLLEFAQGGYKRDPPIPFYASPMGPVGQIQALFLLFTLTAASMFTSLSDTWGPMLAACIIGGGLVFSGMISMIALALMLTPKSKED